MANADFTGGILVALPTAAVEPVNNPRGHGRYPKGVTLLSEPTASEDYRAAFAAGRKRAGSWFAQHGHSLALYRDLQRAGYAQGLQQAPADGAAMLTGFDAGFAAGLADMIAGVNHA